MKVILSFMGFERSLEIPEEKLGHPIYLAYCPPVVKLSSEPWVEPTHISFRYSTWDAIAGGYRYEWDGDWSFMKGERNV